MQILDSKQELIIKSILFEKSIQPKITSSNQLHKFMVKVANKALTLDDWKFAEDNFDQKLFIMHICNGSLGVYNELKQSMKDKELEADMIKRGEHPLFVTNDDAIFFHSNTYHPSLEMNPDSIGTPTHFVFHKLRNSNTFKGFTLEELRAYLLVEYNINPPIHVLKQELSKINKALTLDFESTVKSYEYETDIKSLALQRAKELSTKHGLNYEQSNALAVKIKQQAKNEERSLARKISESAFETFVGSIVETSALLKKK